MERRLSNDVHTASGFAGGWMDASLSEINALLACGIPETSTWTRSYHNPSNIN